MNEHSIQILEALKAKQNSKKALWLTNYVKHDIKSFGVGIPEIREIIKQFEIDSKFKIRPLKTQIEFLNDLMKHEFTESKLAAILYLQLYWKTKNVDELMKITTDWFNNEWITDWNVCDWLCVRLLSPALDKEPELTVSFFTEWNQSPNLWKARASLVPFAQCKTISKHSETILKFSKVLIKREERFCKTAVGWVLRQYSKIDDNLVMGFLEQHRKWTTKEVVRNATKHTQKKNINDSQYIIRITE